MTTPRSGPEAQKAEDHRRLRVALAEVLGTAQGRLVWLWIRREVCWSDKEAPAGDPLAMARFEGRRDAGFALDKALVDLPDLRVALAKDAAALDVNDALYQAALSRSTTRSTDEETSHG